MNFWAKWALALGISVGATAALNSLGFDEYKRQYELIDKEYRTIATGFMTRTFRQGYVLLEKGDEVEFKGANNGMLYVNVKKFGRPESYGAYPEDVTFPNINTEMRNSAAEPTALMYLPLKAFEFLQSLDRPVRPLEKLRARTEQLRDTLNRYYPELSYSYENVPDNGVMTRSDPMDSRQYSAPSVARATEKTGKPPQRKASARNKR